MPVQGRETAMTLVAIELSAWFSFILLQIPHESPGTFMHRCDGWQHTLELLKTGI